MLQAEVGPVTEADVQLAETTSAIILGFNVGASGRIHKLAEERGVQVQRHGIIYELTDGVKNLLEEAIDPILEEKVIGTAEVEQLFTLTLNRKDRREGMMKYTQVAGLRVATGEVSASCQVRVSRGDEKVHVGTVVSLRHFKQEVKVVRKGQECGVVLADFNACEAGDVITFYDVIARKPSLYDALET